VADYTKREASKAELTRFAESWAPKEWKPPRCHCGAPAVIEVNLHTSVKFYCTAHVPADALRDHAN
jgi:NAD(P)-dependent dehydrogenase (short-subunit alcohol dehydrogenase family)